MDNSFEEKFNNSFEEKFDNGRDITVDVAIHIWSLIMSPSDFELLQDDEKDYLLKKHEKDYILVQKSTEDKLFSRYLVGINKNKIPEVGSDYLVTNNHLTSFGEGTYCFEYKESEHKSYDGVPAILLRFTGDYYYCVWSNDEPKSGEILLLTPATVESILN